MKDKSLFKKAFEFKETRGMILSDNKAAITAALISLKRNREKLEEYINKHPSFLYSLQPVKADDGPEIVKLMADAAEKAKVGPMAAVAGALADLAVGDMLLKGAKVAVVENGGEASAFSNKPINVALRAGDHPLSGKIGFKLESFPIGVATSSGVFSHAISFGEAEAVTIFAKNAGLADAVATGIGNLIKGDKPQKVIKYGVDKALSIEGVSGVVILYKGIIGMGGKIPTILKVVKEGDVNSAHKLKSRRLS
ncbi:MAG: UPF0280 family protein [Candidatus Bathyarchaeia archaeon]